MKKLTLKEKAARKEARKVLVEFECYQAWKAAKAANPEKYPEDRPALNRTQALYWKGYGKYWAKCKFGHIVERSVEKSSCPVCDNIRSSIRSAKIRNGNTIELSASEKNELAAIYAKAKKITQETGVQHHVDHIRPLAAGGVHHPRNLRVVTAKENLSKGSFHNGKRRKYSWQEKRALLKQFTNDLESDRVRTSKSAGRRLDRWSVVILCLIGAFIIYALFRL